jgi:ABC-type multidrug transport system fused ATPase/permease subunit
VGASGSGKSTALNVLVGLVAPEHGRVTVAGRDLADLDLRRWRRRVAWVPQRPFLFARSLRDNIALGCPAASSAAVEDAARAAGLGGLLGRLPAGLDTMLGERGHGLSAGERQRVALARAFLLDAELWLLDEPTAGLDGDTEAFVTDSLRRRLAGRTVVMAAHRPALVALANKVVGLDSLAGVGR